MTALHRAKEYSRTLDVIPKRYWAEAFVSLKMDFFRKHCGGMVCTTEFGAEYFDVIVEAILNPNWKQSISKEDSEYKKNFTRLVEIWRSEK